MKIVAVILSLHVASAAVVQAGLRASGKKDTSPLAVQADQLLHLLAQDVSKSEPAKEAKETVAKEDAKEAKAKDAKATKTGLPKGKKAKKVEKAEEKKDDELPGLKAFLPACLAHTKAMVNQIDRSYTDLQLQTVLENECKLSKEFPALYEDGFSSHKACLSFAQSLTEARFNELEGGKPEGYTKFCNKFYELETDQGRKEAAERDRSGASALKMGGMAVVAAILSMWC